MARKPPKLIAIDHDDYHAEHVGKTSDGRQFFLTMPFEPAVAGSGGGGGGREFIALFLFDRKGALVEARIEDLGPRAALDQANSERLRDEWLRSLGVLKHGRITIAPFAVERFGTTFGLVARPPEDEEDEWVVELQPGNFMAFTEPWDSGEYDT